MSIVVWPGEPFSKNVCFGLISKITMFIFPGTGSQNGFFPKRPLAAPNWLVFQVFPGTQVLRMAGFSVFPGSRVLRMVGFSLFPGPQPFRTTDDPYFIFLLHFFAKIQFSN